MHQVRFPFVRRQVKIDSISRGDGKTQARRFVLCASVECRARRSTKRTKKTRDDFKEQVACHVGTGIQLNRHPKSNILTVASKDCNEYKGDVPGFRNIMLTCRTLLDGIAM